MAEKVARSAPSLVLVRMESLIKANSALKVLGINPKV